ncbi:MAG: hypothetical protein JNL38_26115 [Myxococcales bacterium]|jgi:hypothetical protein|nr:hypothetical protein [Myxococcales bacterium]
MSDPYRTTGAGPSELSEDERAAIAREILEHRSRAAARRALENKRRERSTARLVLLVSAPLAILFAYLLLGLARR